MTPSALALSGFLAAEEQTVPRRGAASPPRCPRPWRSSAPPAKPASPRGNRTVGEKRGSEGADERTGSCGGDVCVDEGGGGGGGGGGGHYDARECGRLRLSPGATCFCSRQRWMAARRRSSVSRSSPYQVTCRRISGAPRVGIAWHSASISSRMFFTETVEVTEEEAEKGGRRRREASRGRP